MKSHKHLGVILPKDLKWTKHIDHIHAKSNKAIRMIKAGSHNMPRKCLDKAYSTVVRPTLSLVEVSVVGVDIKIIIMK